MAASQAHEDENCGRALGEYVLRERIAAGGFGAVYRCDQPILGRAAVVKVLRQKQSSPDVAQRFVREARLASQLNHPYAAYVYSFGVENNGLLWIAMELVDGLTLTQWLQTRGPMPLEQFVPFFTRVAAVVQAAHKTGIVHRDLKPANVMVVEHDGQLLPKLLDFGVAKLLGDVAELGPVALLPSEVALLESDDPMSTQPLRRRKPALQRNQLTPASAALGSPPYMAPELWTSPLDVGPAADVYALGVLAYEALTGRLPFDGETADEIERLHLHTPVPPLGDGFSASTELVLWRAMAKRPENRWSSAADLAEALRAELAALPRQQLRVSAEQWAARGRTLLLDPAALSRDKSAVGLSEVEASLLVATRRYLQRATWLCRILVAALHAGRAGRVFHVAFARQESPALGSGL